MSRPVYQVNTVYTFYISIIIFRITIPIRIDDRCCSMVLVLAVPHKLLQWQYTSSNERTIAFSIYAFTLDTK